MKMKLLTICGLILVGCGTLSHIDEHTQPADFAIELLARESDENSNLFIVEPNRTLRVAVGSGVKHGLYPPPTATLTPQQVSELWQIVEEEGLMEIKSAPSAVFPVYELVITAHGKRHRVDAGEDSRVARLAEALKEFGGVMDH